jgi:glutaminyl-tRNA synthetase
VRGEVRLYDHLFSRSDPGADGDLLADLSDRSEEILATCYFEAALAGQPEGTRVQFERLGYFCADPDTTAERPVWNRIATLRDSWSKVQARDAQPPAAR